MLRAATEPLAGTSGEGSSVAQGGDSDDGREQAQEQEQPQQQLLLPVVHTRMGSMGGETGADLPTQPPAPVAGRKVACPFLSITLGRPRAPPGS
jgi:hypothetical protein